MSRKKTWDISDAFSGIGATPESLRSKRLQQDLPTPMRGWQETEIFQPPLLFGNGLRITDWHQLEFLAP